MNQVVMPDAPDPVEKPGRKTPFFSAGRRGVDRVWVTEKKGQFWLGWQERMADGTSRRRAQVCLATNRADAKREATAKSKGLRDVPRPAPRPTGAAPEPVTVGALFDAYTARHLVTKRKAEQVFQATTLEMFQRCVGAEMLAEAVMNSEWERYRKARTSSDPAPDPAVWPEIQGIVTQADGALISGQLPFPNGKPRRRVWPAQLFPGRLLTMKREAVAGTAKSLRGWRWPAPVDKRCVAREFSALFQAFAWGHACLKSGKPWLTVNPFANIERPDDPPPEPPIMDDALYQRLCQVAPQIHADFYDLLVAGHEMGRRGESLVGLRWDDLDLEVGTVRWRRELDKKGNPSQTPLSADAVAMLRARRERLAPPPAESDAVFPVTPRPLRRPKLAAKCPTAARLAQHAAAEAEWKRQTKEAVTRARQMPIEPAFARHLLDRGFRALGVARPKKFGFHALRRKFATDLMSAPIKVVAKLGGWRDHKTVLHYQRVSDGDQRTVLEERRRPGREAAST